MRRHLKAICPGISKNKMIAFMYFRQLAVFRKCVGLANISNYIVVSFFTNRVGNIFNFMISSIKHWPDQMIESAVYSGKNFITRILNNVHGRNKVTRFTYNKFSGLKPNLEMTVVFFLVPVKLFFYFFTE